MANLQSVTSAKPQVTASEQVLIAVASSPSPFDVKSIHLVTPRDTSDMLAVRVMIKLSNETRWRWIKSEPMASQKAIFYAQTILEHHLHHYPHREDIVQRWNHRISESSVPYTGISLMMGMD